jgi:hypothetical protein
MELEKTVSEQAADKLDSELKTALEATKGGDYVMAIKRALLPPIARMLTRFVYQDEEFASAVTRGGDLLSNVNAVVKEITQDKPALSDVEAYAKAVKFYLPAAEVTVSFRINLPNELDADLDDINVADESHAIILDLFDSEVE